MADNNNNSDINVISLHSGTNHASSNEANNQSSNANVYEPYNPTINTLNSYNNTSSQLSSSSSSLVSAASTTTPSDSSHPHDDYSSHTIPSASVTTNENNNNTDDAIITDHNTTTLPSSTKTQERDEPSSSSTTTGGEGADPLLGDTIERVRAIAASFGLSVANSSSSSSSSSSSGGSVLGKRRAGDISKEGGDDSTNDAKKRKKIYVPAQVGTNKDINFIGLLIGPKGSHQRSIETESGCRLYIRGKGSSRDGNGENTEDLHVVVVGDTDEQVTKGEEMVARLYKDPAYASDVKHKQLLTLAADKAGHHDSGGHGRRDGGGRGGGGSSGYDHHHSSSAYGGGSSSHSSSGRYRPPPSQVRHNPDGTMSETFVIPNATAGSIIGKGGETIKDIQQRTGARVQMQPAAELKRGQIDREITISGSPPNVGEAKRFILYLVDKEMDKNPSSNGPSSSGGYGGSSSGGSSGNSRDNAPPPYGHHQQPPPSMGMNPANGATLLVPIPDDKAGTVIGKGGLTIKSIQSRTGVHIQIPKEGDAANPRYRTLTVSAPTREQCEHAQHLIYEVLSTADNARTGGGPGGGPSTMVPGGGVTRVQIQDYEAGVLIGRNGITIRELQEKSQCRIIIPPKADPGTNPPIRTIEITGPPDRTEYARQEIHRILTTAAQSRGAPGSMGGMHSTTTVPTTNMYGSSSIPGYPGQHVQSQVTQQPTVNYGGYQLPITSSTVPSSSALPTGYGQPTYGVPTATAATTAIPGTIPPGSDAAAIAAWQAYHAQYAAWQQQYGGVAAAQQQQQQQQQQQGYPGGYAHY